MMILNYK